MSTVAADRLRSFIERIERLEEERGSIGSDIRDVYAEAKGVGYDVPAMRRVVALRKLDAGDRAEREAMDDVYRHALGMIEDASEEQVDARALKLAGEVDRCLALTNSDTPPPIAAIMRELQCSAGKASKIRGLAEQRLVGRVSFSSPHKEDENEIVVPIKSAPREMTEDDLGKPTPTIGAAAGDQLRDGTGQPETAKTPQIPRLRSLPIPSTEPDLTLPSFLRRERVPA